MWNGSNNRTSYWSTINTKKNIQCVSADITNVFVWNKFERKVILTGSPYEPLQIVVDGASTDTPVQRDNVGTVERVILSAVTKNLRNEIEKKSTQMK